MIKEKIRVLIVEDSRLYQAYLKKIIESDDCLCAAGTADSGAAALAMIPEVKPDVITLDLCLPDGDDFSLLKEILRRWKIPVIVVSADAAACEKAITCGASDFIAKIQSGDEKEAEQFRLLLKMKLKMTTEIRPVSPGSKHLLFPAEKRPDIREDAQDPGEKIIAIGASLGGTETTLQLLQKLPDTLPGIVIVQHLPAEFTRAYAMRLNNFCPLAVHEAKNGDPVLPGTALIARGGEQLTVYRADHGYRVKAGGIEKVGGFCPSVDVLFRSVGDAAGENAIGVILTGMGRDGAAGLRHMHDKGACTFGQSKETCAVFGMPGAAYHLGGVDRLLPPEAIANEIIRICCKTKKSEEGKP